MRVRSLGWEDPLEESMTTYSSILTWRVRYLGFAVRGYDLVGLGWALESIYLKSLCFQNVPQAVQG